MYSVACSHHAARLGYYIKMLSNYSINLTSPAETLNQISQSIIILKIQNDGGLFLIRHSDQYLMVAGEVVTFLFLLVINGPYFSQSSAFIIRVIQSPSEGEAFSFSHIICAIFRVPGLSAFPYIAYQASFRLFSTVYKRKENKSICR